MKTSSISEQVASHLRDEITRGRWKGVMPGRDRLARDLGISPWSVQRALEILTEEGLLQPQGGGKRRTIAMKRKTIAPRSTHIGILPFDEQSTRMGFMLDMRHQLVEAGHTVSLMPLSLTDLDMDISRLAQENRKHEADAQVVVAGPNKILEWFAQQSTPVFALFGGHEDLPIAAASPDKRPSLAIAVERLISLGHRRIVFLLRRERREPPTIGLQPFLDIMKSHDIPVGSYNLPDWEENPKGLQECLDSLLAVTPPTALIVDEPEHFLAAQQHLANRGIVAPRDVSLISTDPDRSFSWHQPPIAHISWSLDPIVRRIVRWANNVSRGKDDRRKTYVSATFIEGGTIGPARK